MIRIKNVTVTKKEQKLLDTVSCTLPARRITLFMGKSGAGKTTLLKTAAGIISPDQGTIEMNGVSLKNIGQQKRAENIGFVFQDFNLFPHLTVLENCTDPLIVHEYSAESARNKAVETLKKLEMDNYLNRYPKELSGGQQQRVAIARALCLNPKTILLDEPTASLDPANTDMLITTLQELARSGLAIGVSSQDMEFVKKIFDRAYYLAAGKIVEQCENRQKLARYPNIAAWISAKN